jgi:hypothetical protein
MSLRRLALFILPAFLLIGAGAAPKEKLLSSVDLAQPFGARSAWRLTAWQGPDVADLQLDAGEKAPGAIRLCVSKDDGRTCQPDLRNVLMSATGPADLFAEPHFLDQVQIVQPGAGQALLLLQVASLHAGDGDQRIAKVALAYDREQDSFVPVYEKQTGRNNNQEVRYIDAGPLKGAIISADPTGDAPFGFWIDVNTRAGQAPYKPVLRYRSATHYGDGNPLAVIDSEMPNIQQRLGLWHPGMKLPLPDGACPNPHLVRQELWCQ